MFERIKAWVKRHKKAVIVTATIVGIVGTAAVVIIAGKKKTIPIAELAKKIIPEVPEATKATGTAAKEVASAAANTVETVSVEVDGVVKTFPRSDFIRQLHEGWKASPQKLAQAAEMGIDLKEGETIVNSCIVKMKA